MSIPVVIVLHGINYHPRLNTRSQLEAVGVTLTAAV